MPQLTRTQRSKLLEKLLGELGQQGQRQPLTGGEAAARLGTTLLQKKRIDRLKKEQATAARNQGASEAALLGAMTSGQQSNMGPLRPEFAGKLLDTSPDPGIQPTAADPQAQLSQLLTNHPDSPIGQMAAQMQLQNAMATPKPPEAPKTRNRTDGEETVVEEWNPSKGAWSEVSRGPRYRPGTEVIVNNNPEAPPSKIAAWAEDIGLLDEDMRKTEILTTMDPREFLTYYGRGKKGLLDFADKFGLTDEDSQAWLGKAQTFKGLTEQIFQGIRREVTGAQAAKIELDVLEQAFLSTKMGPSQYQAALTLIGEMQQGIRDVKQSLIEDGITPDSNPALFARSLDRALAQYSSAGSQFAENVKETNAANEEQWGYAIGSEKKANGLVFEYIGGDPNDQANWIQKDKD